MSVNFVSNFVYFFNHIKIFVFAKIKRKQKANRFRILGFLNIVSNIDATFSKRDFNFDFINRVIWKLINI